MFHKWQRQHYCFCPKSSWKDCFPRPLLLPNPWLPVKWEDSWTLPREQQSAAMAAVGAASWAMATASSRPVSTTPALMGELYHPKKNRRKTNAAPCVCGPEDLPSAITGTVSQHANLRTSLPSRVVKLLYFCTHISAIRSLMMTGAFNSWLGLSRSHLFMKLFIICVLHILSWVVSQWWEKTWLIGYFDGDAYLLSASIYDETS